jgi:hypothetical protein
MGMRTYMNARLGRATEVILRAAIVAVTGMALVHPALAVEPSKLPIATGYAWAWALPGVVYGASGGAALWRPVVLEGSVAAAFGGIGDIGGGLWNVSVRAGVPIPLPTQGGAWFACVPQLGARQWGRYATFGTASISIDGGPLPTRGRVAFYGRFGLGLGLALYPADIRKSLPVLPEVLVGIGVAVF